MKEIAIRLREFAEDWANTPVDTDVDIRRLNVNLFLDKLMRIIDDGYMSKELVNQEAEKRIAERQLTDKQIERQLTTSHYHYEKGHYYKVRKDRMFGAKWYRDRLVSQKTEGGGE